MKQLSEGESGWRERTQEHRERGDNSSESVRVKRERRQSSTEGRGDSSTVDESG